MKKLNSPLDLFSDSGLSLTLPGIFALGLAMPDSVAGELDDPDHDGYYSSITTHGYGNHSVRTIRWRLIQYEDGSEELYDH